MRKRKIGLSIRYPYENVFKSGFFECIEYSIGANFNLEGAFEEWEKNTDKVKELCRKYGVKMRTYHLPFNGERFNGVYMHAPYSFDEGIRERTLEYTKRQIEYLSDMGIEYVILHGSLRIPMEERAERVEFFIDYLKKLCDFCKPYGITVAVETLLECCIGGGGDEPDNRIKEMRYIMGNVNRDNVGICLDNNHFILSSNVDFVKELGQYVVTTHFSDYDGETERHWFPGKGITDWRLLCDLLIEKGYKGPWVFEVGFGDDGPTDEKLSELVAGWNKAIED